MPIAFSIIGLVLGLGINRLVVHWPGEQAPHDSTSRHPWVYWMTPVLAAGSIGVLALVQTDMRQIIVSGGFLLVLLLLAALDIEYRIIPNIIVFPATLAAIVFSPIATPLSAVAGAGAGLLFFGALRWIGTRLYGIPVLGMGDVKLVMLLGAIVGVMYIWPVVAAGMLLAGVVAAALLIGRRVERGATLPYGSFLALTGLLALLFALPG